EDALVAPGRVQDTAGPGDLVVVGRVRLSDGGHLGRVDTGGGHESERDGVERLGALTRLVGDVEVHRVHRPPAERRGGEGDPGAGVAWDVPVLTRDPGAARLALGEPAGRAAHRRQQ